MIDPDMAIRIDAVLGRIDNGESDPPNSLLQSAKALVDLDDRDRSMPIQDFRAQLKNELFTTQSNSISKAAATQRPMPFHPNRDHREREARMNGHRLVVIAASLLLLLGGMGAVISGPLRTDREHEPSAIPAASFASPSSGTIQAQAASLPAWVTAPPENAGSEDENAQLAGGRIFRSFMKNQGNPYVQAVDADTGTVLWERSMELESGVMIATDDALYVTDIDSATTKGVYRLSALEAETGTPRWHIVSNDRPVAAATLDDRVLVLRQDNRLDAYTFVDGALLYSVDVGGNSQPPLGLPVDVSFPYSQPGRIATIGNTTAVVLADGSVAAIDGTTGRPLWWVYRTLQGAAEVLAVGDQLVVFIDGTYVTPPDGTPLPAPAPSATPTSSGCQTETTTDLSGTLIGDTSPPDYVGGLYVVDPVTGEIAWSGTTWLPPYRWNQIMAGNKTLLLDTSVRTGPHPVEGMWCSLDMTTGIINPLTDPSSIALGSFINDVGGRSVEQIAIFADGNFVAYPVDATTENGMTVVDLSPYLSGAFSWIGILDDAVYISTSDGTLMKVSPSA